MMHVSDGVFNLMVVLVHLLWVSVFVFPTLNTGLGQYRVQLLSTN